VAASIHQTSEAQAKAIMSDTSDDTISPHLTDGSDSDESSPKRSRSGTSACAILPPLGEERQVWLEDQSLVLRMGSSLRLMAEGAQFLNDSKEFNNVDPSSDWIKWTQRLPEAALFYAALVDPMQPAAKGIHCVLRAVVDGMPTPTPPHRPRLIIDYVTCRKEMRGRGYASMLVDHVINSAAAQLANVYVLALEDSCVYWMNKGFVLEEGEFINARLLCFPDVHLLRRAFDPADPGSADDLTLRVEFGEEGEGEEEEGGSEEEEGADAQDDAALQAVIAFSFQEMPTSLLEIHAHEHHGRSAAQSEDTADAAEGDEEAKLQAGLALSMYEVLPSPPPVPPSGLPHRHDLHRWVLADTHDGGGGDGPTRNIATAAAATSSIALPTATTIADTIDATVATAAGLPHTAARSQANPQYPPRFPVPDIAVPFTVALPGYTPTRFTAGPVLANDAHVTRGGWADPLDFSALSVDVWAARRSFEGPIVIGTDGRPRNPRGRTGMCERGLLGKWGPNHAADPIVTRFLPEEEPDLPPGGGRCRGRLQVVAIKRRDCGAWALPGGMVDVGESVSVTVRREFAEEAGHHLADPVLHARFEQLSARLFSSGQVVYRGYVDDPRNTDNAWMETTAFHFHCDAEMGALLPLHAGDDAADVTWLDVDDADERYVGLYASHKQWVDQVAAKLKAGRE
jgi:ADP-ribose pyrophosphatase